MGVTKKEHNRPKKWKNEATVSVLGPKAAIYYRKWNASKQREKKAAPARTEDESLGTAAKTRGFESKIR
ncbi:hypothetical protein NL676_011268 [Syzygium grande]|nr:hypothetical protein NL676_011268 [Syzygium grande]